MAQQQPPSPRPPHGMALQQPPSPRPPHAAVRPISPALGVGCCSTPARASNLVGAILAGVLSIVLAPAIFALVVSPIVLLGLACSSHARTWLRVDWSPCVKLLAVLVDIALAVIAVGTHLLEHIVLQPVALLAYSLLRAPARSATMEPTARCRGSRLAACAHSRGGLGASAASSAARSRGQTTTKSGPAHGSAREERLVTADQQNASVCPACCSGPPRAVATVAGGGGSPPPPLSLLLRQPLGGVCTTMR